MANLRHSYEVQIHETSNGETRLLATATARAEGVHLDAAIKHAREIISGYNRVLRSLSVGVQNKAHGKGPTTGIIVAVVLPHEYQKKEGSIARSRLNKGLPKRIAK